MFLTPEYLMHESFYSIVYLLFAWNNHGIICFWLFHGLFFTSHFNILSWLNRRGGYWCTWVQQFFLIFFSADNIACWNIGSFWLFHTVTYFQFVQCSSSSLPKHILKLSRIYIWNFHHILYLISTVNTCQLLRLYRCSRKYNNYLTLYFSAIRECCNNIR